MFYLYIHTVPNGKIYIGQTENPDERWQNGSGYHNNKPFYNAIMQYGWDNIKHELVGTFKNRRDAENYEAVLIFLLDSENEQVGYNQTKIRESILGMYAKRVPMGNIKAKTDTSGYNIFEKSNLPISACNELIDQWIFNKKHREIAKDRLINGMPYDELAKKYNFSVRHVKTIMSENIRILEDHI